VPATGSISSGFAEYFLSQAFRNLRATTQAKRRSYLERIRRTHGHLQLGSMPREFIIAVLDTMTPHMASSTLVALRHFCNWAVERRFSNLEGC
jgi:hypothetical protein